jgi:hypothetical protein
MPSAVSHLRGAAATSAMSGGGSSGEGVARSVGRRYEREVARHPETGVSTATVIHNFGRVGKVDRAGLARLVSSISRFLDPATALAAACGMDVEVLDSRRLGGGWTLDRVWERLGIGWASAPRSGRSPTGAGWPQTWSSV